MSCDFLKKSPQARPKAPLAAHWRASFSTLFLALLWASLTVGCVTSSMHATLNRDFPSLTTLEKDAPVDDNIKKARLLAQKLCFHKSGVQVSQRGQLLSLENNWDFEVRAFTADALSTLLESDARACSLLESYPTHPDALKVKTMFTHVLFDVPEPDVFFFKLSKEVDIALDSTFPDGTHVRTEFHGPISDGNENLLENGFAMASPVVDIMAFVGTLLLITTSGVNTLSPLGCGCLLSLAFSGVAFNAAHQGAAYWVAQQEEKRLSTLYAEALVLHAKALRAAYAQQSALRKMPALAPQDSGVAPPESMPIQSWPQENAVPPPPPLMFDPADEEGKDAVTEEKTEQKNAPATPADEEGEDAAAEEKTEQKNAPAAAQEKGAELNAAP